MATAKILFTFYLSIFTIYFTIGQSILPPTQPWTGASEKLIVSDEHPWVTPAELNDFRFTPDYAETKQWLEKLAASSGLISLKSIGISAQQRSIQMVIASGEQALHQGYLDKVEHPTILVQAGIHSGEIDGKDAGMMLLRDIAKGDKSNLLDSVNLLFIPILAVDAHENAGPFNRPNQRGPENMGWRTNARNLNLNRDYSKLETEGIRAITYLINKYDPVLYVDLHVTDGADYQYDITYSRPSIHGYSPAISGWLSNQLSPEIDQALEAAGHIPGPLIFTHRTDDFEHGIIKYAMPLRFSDGYGLARQLPTILVENHSLKPYKQRVLGTYIFLEQLLKSTAADSKALELAVKKDREQRPDSLALYYGYSDTQTDSIELLLIDYDKKISPATNREYTAWNGQLVSKKLPYIKMEKPMQLTRVPEAYYIPIEWISVIRKLAEHGIEMEILKEPVEKELLYYVVDAYEINSRPVEGHFQFREVALSQKPFTRTIPKGSVRISTDQDLGRLAVLLLEPDAPDSFFKWGYFNEVLSRTEYIESYVMSPLIEQMLAEDPGVKEEFEQKKADDPGFAENPRAIFEWFYAKTPYFDKNWKVIPVGIEF